MRGATSSINASTLTITISIHAPLCGERLRQVSAAIPFDRFQSTLPYAGSDYRRMARNLSALYFNPRSPMRGATEALAKLLLDSEISIHAPLCGERRWHNVFSMIPIQFQSTLPYAGSDLSACRSALCSVISIHAPLCGERPLMALGMS